MTKTIDLSEQKKLMEENIWKLKEKFGKKLYIPAHHYQKDEVIQFADDVGDSLRLAELASANKEAKYILFCGVHFMAETADMLTEPDQIVLLPEADAGCPMADMATIEQAESGWQQLTRIFDERMLPLTYINSTAAIKAFVGRKGGSTVTSSNAKKVLEWAFTQKEIVFFLPDRHLGKNTAFELGIKPEQMALWNPHRELLEYTGELDDIKIILWKGFCAVHQRFTVADIMEARQDPQVQIVVHPESTFEVVQAADYNGSTSRIVSLVNNSPAGSKWAIGTESNLVNRLAKTNPDKEIRSLSKYESFCNTMNLITLESLYIALEKINNNNYEQQITVDEETAREAILSLERMLSIK